MSAGSACASPLLPRDARDRLRMQRYPPPPCGEGLGVGEIPTHPDPRGAGTINEGSKARTPDSRCRQKEASTPYAAGSGSGHGDRRADPAFFVLSRARHRDVTPSCGLVLHRERASTAPPRGMSGRECAVVWEGGDKFGVDFSAESAPCRSPSASISQHQQKTPSLRSCEASIPSYIAAEGPLSRLGSRLVAPTYALAKVMADSDSPDNKRFKRLAAAWQSVEPLWRGLQIVLKAVDEGKKAIGLLTLLIGGGTTGVFLSFAPQKSPSEIARPVPQPPEEKPPPSLAPFVDKPKPACISVSLIKLGQDILRGDDALLRRSYLRRPHCGWHLNADGQPYRHSGDGSTSWRLRFRTRDGVVVIAETDRINPFGDGDIVQVGGTVGALTIENGAPTVLLQRAWIVRR